MQHLLLRGDARRIPLADQSVQCVVTSPPYFGLRDYGSAGQIGLEPSHREYVAAMVGVFREVRRVLRDDGTVWLNLGDTYNAYNGNAGPSSSISKGRHDAARPDLARGHGLLNKALKPKDLLMIPHRVAIALQEDGWFVRMDVVWHKRAPMPESVRDRPTKAHEFVFLLAKSERYFYDAIAVRERSVSDHGSGNGFKREHYLSKQNADGSPRGNDEPWEVQPDRNLRSVWTLGPESFTGAHFAVMPTRLVSPCVRAGTSERGQCPACGSPWARRAETSREPTRPGTNSTRVRTTGWEPGCSCDAGPPVPQVVLDPFSGSGTVGVVATSLGRRYVGLDLSAEYIDLARRRISRPHMPRSSVQEPDLPLFERAVGDDA